MRAVFLTLLLMAATLLTPIATAVEGSLRLGDIRKTFRPVHSSGNYASILYDGWQIAFLSHNKDELGAIFITEKKDARRHEFDLSETATRVATLLNMSTPQIMEIESSNTEGAILIEGDVMDALGTESDNLLSGSPLEGMAFLLQDGYFYIHDLLPNGYLHWKTVKRSGVELLMPMAPTRLSAVEITGRQEMNDYASEVLARKLGFGSSSTPAQEAINRQMGWQNTSYYNARGKVAMAHANNRTTFGKVQYAGHMLANRYGGQLNYPDQDTAWPEETQDEPAQEDKPTKEKETPPLTPEAAREAYTNYLKAL